MSQSANEQFIRALVEGGLRAIRNMIPEPPSKVTIAPVPQGGSQLRLDLRQPGRGAQAYSPAKSTTEEARQVLKSEGRALPAETSAQRNQRLLEQAQESRLVVRPQGRPGRGFNDPEFADYVYNRARTPQTVRAGQSANVQQYQAPVPAWARAEQLRISDPSVYQSVRSIAETTARERGVRAEDVMEALLSPEGTQSNLLRTLSAPGEIVPSAGGRMGVPGSTGVTTGAPGGALARTATAQPVSQDVIPANVYEVAARPGVLPEGNALNMFNDLGGVRVVDMRQALATPGFVEAMGRQLADLASPQAVGVATDIAGAGTTAGKRIPLAPVVGLGTLTGLGIGSYFSDRQNQAPGLIEPPQAPGTTGLGVPTSTPETGANLPAVTGAPLTAPPVTMPGATNAIPGTVNPSSLTASAAPAVQPGPPVAPAPATAAPVVSSMGAGSVVQRTDSSNSDYSQAVQNAAQALRSDISQYGPGQAGAYYAAQEAYAKAPGRAEAIIGALKGMGAPASVGIESEKDFTAWAKAHPDLAYRLQLQMQPRGVNQQMPVAQGVQVGTSLGTNFRNNAEGESAYSALNAATNSQGASEIAAALRPQGYATLQAPRSASYAGY